MKKKILITTIGIVFLALILMIPTFAAPPGGMEGVSNPWSGNSQLRSAGNKIIGIVWAAGGVASVGLLMIMGIKYIMASPEEKGSLKQKLVPYMFGAILTFGAVNIIGIIATFTNGLFK